MAGDFAIIIRAAGERTLAACHALAMAQAGDRPVEIIEMRPFEEALRATYRRGMELGLPWTVTLDADVLLRDGALAELVAAAARMPDHYAQLEGRIFDRVMGSWRPAGHRVYRTGLLGEALDRIPAPGARLRPEFETLFAMTRAGFPSRRVDIAAGLHDFEQFYTDLFRKSATHAAKHREHGAEICARARKLAATDPDFLVIFAGFWSGLAGQAPRADELAERLALVGIGEKPPLPAEGCAPARVAEILADQPPLDPLGIWDLAADGSWQCAQPAPARRKRKSLGRRLRALLPFLTRQPQAT